MSVGSQVNFFLLPADLDALEQTLRSTIPLGVLAQDAPTSALERRDSLRLRAMGMDRLRILLVPTVDEYLLSLLREVLRDQGFISASNSPVVELDRCYLEHGVLRRGRLYARPQEHGAVALSNFGPSFASWVARLFRITRRSLIRSPDGEYIGPHALDAVAAGSIRLEE